MTHYLDSSALVRLVVPGPQLRPLRRWWSHAPGRAVSSQIARTEVVRAVRHIAPDCADDARDLLRRLVLTAETPAVLAGAARVDPPSLRSLDAIHLASTLDLGSDLEAFVTYDERLAAAARGCGVTVVSPQ